MLLKLAIAVVMFAVIFRLGLALLRSVGRAPPPPPPAGEMPKVNLRYRCTVCGAEVRMTRAGDEDPEPPRHCLEEMEDVPVD